MSIASMEGKNVHLVLNLRVNCSTVSMASTACFSNCSRIAADYRLGKATQRPRSAAR